VAKVEAVPSCGQKRAYNVRAVGVLKRHYQVLPRQARAKSEVARLYALDRHEKIDRRWCRRLLTVLLVAVAITYLNG
jgi:hypothetical protein